MMQGLCGACHFYLIKGTHKGLCRHGPPSVRVEAKSPDEEVTYEHIPVKFDGVCGQYKEAE